VSLKLASFSLFVGGVVVLVAAVTDLTLGRAAILAPVLVIGLGAVAGLLVFWGRVAAHSLREVQRPGLVIGAAAALVGLLVGLTLLGVNLPHE
jgi:hypothetical protein